MCLKRIEHRTIKKKEFLVSCFTEFVQKKNSLLILIILSYILPRYIILYSTLYTYSSTKRAALAALRRLHHQ